MNSYTDEVYNAIYEKILDGTLRPGEKLQIVKLSEMFNVGTSPVREALSKLTSTNLVIALSQKGFRVAPFNENDMKDLYTTRMNIEMIAFSLSIQNGDADWEANLIASFHRLDQIEKSIKFNTLDEYIKWEKYHREFNIAMLAACNLTHLLAIQENLYHQTERYRRIWFQAGLKNHKTLPFAAKQKSIMEAGLAHDTDKALDLLESHFENAVTLISKYLFPVRSTEEIFHPL